MVDKFVFDEAKEYGMYAEIVIVGFPDSTAVYHIVGLEWGEEAIALAKKWLQRHMNECIPVEYQESVEWIIKAPPSEHLIRQNGVVGWKYSPAKVKV